jgi:colicin import membrane protein
MLEKIYEDGAHGGKPKRKSHTPYLKLVAHAQEQVAEREEALARVQQQVALAEACAKELETRLATLAQEREAEHARWQAELARVAEERAAEAQARQAAQAQRAELETRLATLAQERVELVGQLSSLEKTRITELQEMQGMINGLTEARDELLRRMTEMERTPAARLQALLQRWHRPIWGK